MSRSVRGMLRYRMSAFRRDVEGSALLEGALVIPVLFSLIFGVLEFSYYFYQQHLVSTGVWDAATYLARCDDPTTTVNQTAAQNLAATGSVAGGSARRVQGFNPGDVSISFTSGDNSIDAVTGLRPFRLGPQGGDKLAVRNA